MSTYKRVKNPKTAITILKESINLIDKGNTQMDNFYSDSFLQQMFERFDKINDLFNAKNYESTIQLIKQFVIFLNSDFYLYYEDYYEKLVFFFFKLISKLILENVINFYRKND